jgi:hypothetical protein
MPMTTIGTATDSGNKLSATVLPTSFRSHDILTFIHIIPTKCTWNYMNIRLNARNMNNIQILLPIPRVCLRHDKNPPLTRSLH